VIKFYLFSILVCVSFSQKITVICGPGDSKFVKFEKEMIEEIIAYHNATTLENLKIDFRPTLFYSMLEQMKKAKATDYIFAIQTISITEERERLFDFSTPYMVNRIVIAKSRVHTTHLQKDNKKAVYGTTKASIYEPLVLDLSKKTGQSYKLFDSNIELAKAIDEGNIDYCIIGQIAIWTFNLKIVEELTLTNKYDSFALLFSKNSVLAKLINKSYNEYLKSDKFNVLINKYFDKEAIKYFQKGLKRNY
jgi:glutamine transport system substrate-binding protein